MKILIIPQPIYKKMIDYSQNSLPNEGCGYLAGIIVNEEAHVKEIYCLTNMDESPEHFSMDPQEQFQSFQEATQSGYRFLSCFHSHPNTPSRPSVEDLRYANDPSLLYTIVSLQNKDNITSHTYTVKKEELEKSNQSLFEGEMPHQIFVKKELYLEDSENTDKVWKIIVNQVKLEVL